MTWRSWRTHFERNASRPLPELAASDIPGPQRPALAHCLARFQLGESGGHRIVAQIEDQPLEGSDADHRAALQLFVREEARHAEILARLVVSLGGTLLRHNWTKGAFSIGRNLFGLRDKLLVLNVAEVIGISCYRLLCERLPSGTTRQALLQIVADEEHHLAFHSALFARQTRHRAWTRACWWIVGSFACVTVVLDHGAALHALGVGRRALWRRLRALLADGDRRMNLGSPQPQLEAGRM